MRKVALMMIVSGLLLTTGRAMATYSFSLSTKMHASPFLTNTLKEDSEKLITNVKVFYNPVAEQIAINFKLSKESTVAIKVMDALGNEVLNLMNGKLDEGLQNLSFETNGKLATGVYFVRVTSGTEVVVKRISVR